MFLLGVLLLMLGYALGIGILVPLGVILLVLGAVFEFSGYVGRPVLRRRRWY